MTSPQSPATSDSNGTLLVIIVALLGVAVLGAGIATLVRRARYAPGIGSQGADGFAAPAQPTSSHDETWPFTRGDY